MRSWHLPIVLLAVLLAPACFGGDDDEPSPAPSLVIATATRAPEVTATATAEPAAPTATPAPAPLSAVWLFDVASGDRMTLFEDAGTRIVSVVRVQDDIVWVRDRRNTDYKRFDYQGNVVADVPTPVPSIVPSCETTNDGAVVDGRSYAGIGCGLISPDERWMLYEVDAGTQAVGGGAALPVWDQWGRQPADRRASGPPGRPGALRRL